MSCSHKTDRHHQSGVCEKTGRKIWVCSGCGGESVWTDGHQYYGNAECLACGFPWVDYVLCSEKCAKLISEELSCN